MTQVDKVLEIVQKSQGVLPVEVASKLNLDSFLANAYLSQLVESGKIKRSTVRVGGSYLYFLPGQEKLAESRIGSLIGPTQKTARMFAPEGAEKATPEVEQRRLAFVNRLKDIESGETKLRQAKKMSPNQFTEPGNRIMPITLKKVSQDVVGHEPSVAVGGQLMPKPKKEEVVEEIETVPEPAKVEPESEEIVETEPEEVTYEELEIKTGIEEQPKVEQKEEEKPAKSFAREVFEKTFFKKPEAPLEPGKVVDTALAFLVDAGADIISKELKKKGKDADIVADIPTKIGNIKMLILVRDKKSITEADLSIAYTEGIHRKFPVLFITNGKPTKLARKYHEVIAGLVKFKSLEIK